jgi:predicted type IV restriction endonuclease
VAFSPGDYDLLERAVARGTRVAVTRRGSQWIVVAHRLDVRRGREVFEARHPSTGEMMHFYIDEIQRIEAVR